MEICVDSSVIVKWFKVGEEHEREASRLRDEALSKAHPHNFGVNLPGSCQSLG